MSWSDEALIGNFGLMAAEETKSMLTTALSKLATSDGFEEDSVGILVEGDIGLGKTTFLNSLAKKYSQRVRKRSILDVSLLRPLSAGEGAKKIVDYLELHKIDNDTDTLFLLDNLDAIIEAEDAQTILLSALLYGLESLPKGRCLVVATCTNRKNVPSDLLYPALLGRTITLPYPAQTERESILRSLLFDSTVEITSTNDHGVEETLADGESFIVSMAKTTQGCSYGDLLHLLRSEVFKSESREGDKEGGKVSLPSQSLMVAAMEYRPSVSVMKSGGNGSGSSLIASTSSALGGSWQLVGMQQAQSRLLQAVTVNDATRSAYGSCSGVLLHGPTGCGKSALIDWLAHELHGTHKLLVLHCADLVHKVVGESESRLTSYFSRARALAPCLLVLDNVDIVFASAGSDGGGLGRGAFQPRSSRSKHAALDRLLSTLLIELDGIATGSAANATASSHGDIVVIASASDKNLLDKALKRPGRLEEHIEVGLPSRDQRLSFFAQEVSRRSPQQSRSPEDSAENHEKLYVALADRTAGYNYAQLNLMVQEASYNALRAHLHSSYDNPTEAFFSFLGKYV